MNHLGTDGENQAAALLKQKGYRILARNFAAPVGEIDIIARHKDMLVFVEVKQRTSQDFGGPLAAVTRAKQLKIARTAAYYIKTNVPKFDKIRFDVICILPEETTHIEGAFLPPRTTL